MTRREMERYRSPVDADWQPVEEAQGGSSDLLLYLGALGVLALVLLIMGEREYAPLVLVCMANGVGVYLLAEMWHKSKP